MSIPPFLFRFWFVYKLLIDCVLKLGLNLPSGKITDSCMASAKCQHVYTKDSHKILLFKLMPSLLDRFDFHSIIASTYFTKLFNLH